MAFISLLLLASAGAQTINVHQIRPGTNGQVVTTVSGVSNWGPGSFTLGSTHLQLGGTYTTITGLVVNGVSLVSGGSSSLFLNQAGSYTAPPTGTTTFAALLSGTNTGMAGICGTGCSLQPSGSGTITSNAVNLAGVGNGGVFGNLPVSNLNGGTGASGTTFWAGDGTWKPAGGGVLSINGVAGAFTFAGTGQSCVGTTCTFGGGGSSGITGLTAGHIPLAGSATTLTANSHIDEVTNPGSETITQPVIINSSGPASIAMTYNSTPPVVGSGTTAVYATDASGNAETSEAGAAFSRICTAANGACPGGSGTVTGVTGTAPVASSGGTAPAISCPTCVTASSPGAGIAHFAGSTQAVTSSAVNLATGDVTGLLPVAKGGTGTATPAIVAGINVTVSGTWPNQTINSSGGGGGSNQAQTMVLPNDPTGTATGFMSQWHDTSRVTYTIINSPLATGGGGTNSNVPLVGVCTANCGTSGFGTFQYAGNVSWVCDVQTKVGDWVTLASAATSGAAGECDDPFGTASVGTTAYINENPELNSIVGVVTTANTGAHTASVINLIPFYGFGQSLSGLPQHGQGFMTSNYGSPFSSTTYWGQNLTTASGSSGASRALSGGAPIDLWNSTGFFEINNGASGLGVSGRDIVLDNLSHGFGIPPTGSIRVNASLYNVPTVATVTGTTALAVTQTTGVYQWTLSGNTTLSAPSVDNAGHIITFDIIQAAAGGPFTFTWNAVFKNPPTISATASAHTVASFYFDGTNYNCVGGCPSTGSNGFPITIGSTSVGSGSTTTTIAGLTLTAPVLGAATATSINGTTIPSSGTLTQTIASGTSALGTSAIASGVCATVVTTSATGTATTDVVPWGFNADPTSTTGYSPSATGMLTIIAYPTANNVNFKVCNNTSASITPGAVTLNWRIVR